MSRSLALATVLLLAVLNLPSQAQLTYLPACSAKAPYFCTDAAYFVEDGIYIVEVYFEICNEGIQFIRTDKGFKGQVDVSIVLLDSDDRQVGGDTYRLRLYASKYDETTSVDSCRVKVLRIKGEPGKFKLVVKAHDSDSRATSLIEGILTVPEIETTPGLSDLVFLKASDHPAGSRWKGFVPVVNRKLNVDRDSLALYYEIYCGQESDTLTLRETIANGNDVLVKREQHIRCSGKLGRLCDLGADSLSNGHYTITVALIGSEGKVITERSKDFDVLSEAFYFDRDVEGAVALLTYIASGSFIDSFVKADVEERKRLWEEFWREKDPTPQTPKNEFYDEHVRRFHYANEHFGTSMTEGWRTDRGRVYIVYGEPDEVEKYPGEVRRKPMEIWYYYSRGKRFIFVDETGFGDYVLVGQYR